MTKRLFMLTFLLTSITFIKAQDIPAFLKQVSENNPEIIAYQKLLNARKIEAKTGLTPSDPSVSLGYMPGNTDEIGIKKTWSVNQSFSFPSKYILMKKISRNTIILAEQEFSLGKLMTLLNAKLTLYDLIYNEKSLNILKKRKEGYDRLKSAWGKMLDSGEATILEYNKISLELSSLNLRIERIRSEITVLKEKLRYLGGNNMDLSEVIDFPISSEPDLDKLLSEKAAFHPAFILPETVYQISQQEVKLSRTGSLPEFQAGYASEIIPGEIYTGPVVGMTIPLWSNSNKIKTAIAMADYSAALRDAELLRLKSLVRNEFDNMVALKKSLEEIKSILGTNKSHEYLETALSSGEISITSYFLYLDVIFETEDRLLELENNYNKSLASLSDYELIR